MFIRPGSLTNDASTSRSTAKTTQNTGARPSSPRGKAPARVVPYGSTIRPAILCLIDGYGCSAQDITVRLRSYLQRARNLKAPWVFQNCPPLEPEPYVWMALSDSSGETLKALNWTNSTCIPITKAVIGSFWNDIRSNLRISDEDRPAQITAMRADWGPNPPHVSYKNCQGLNTVLLHSNYEPWSHSTTTDEAQAEHLWGMCTFCAASPF